MIENKIEAAIVKVCAMGLVPEMLGKSILTLQPQFLQLKDKYGFNVCGEGCEYESAVLDCPLYKRKISVIQSKTVDLGNEFSPVSNLVFEKLELIEKSQAEIEAAQQIIDNLKIRA